MEFAFTRSARLIEESPNNFRSWFLDRFEVASQSIADLKYRPWPRRLSGAISQGILRITSTEIGKLFDLMLV
jgi:hypothetical protein